MRPNQDMIKVYKGPQRDRDWRTTSNPFSFLPLLPCPCSAASSPFHLLVWVSWLVLLLFEFSLICLRSLLFIYLFVVTAFSALYVIIRSLMTNELIDHLTKRENNSCLCNIRLIQRKFQHHTVPSRNNNNKKT